MCLPPQLGSQKGNIYFLKRKPMCRSPKWIKMQFSSRTERWLMDRYPLHQQFIPAHGKLMPVIRWQSPDQCSAQQQNPKTEGSAMSATAMWPKRPQCDSPRGSAILCTETSKTNKGVMIDVKMQVGWVWQVSGWRCDVTDGSEKCIELLRR